MSILAPLFNLILRGKQGARLTILKYHRVLPEPDSIIPDLDANCFDWQMKNLRTHFNVLPLFEAVQQLRSGSLPARSVCITFDDGYSDNCDIALPILLKYGLPATFFVSTGFLNGGMMWNDKIFEAVKQWKDSELDLDHFTLGKYKLESGKEIGVIHEVLEKLKYLPLDERADIVEQICDYMHTSLPSNLMMTDKQVKTLHEAGMEIGGHTVNHPILTKVNVKQAAEEIQQGKDYLESLLGTKLKSFAYPNGVPNQDYAGEHIKILRDLEFSCAVSTSWGVARCQTDLFQLPRMAPSTRSPFYFLGRILENTRINPQFA